MRFPVFAARRNPSPDRAIVRKSRSFVESEVDAGRAEWVDAADYSKGIICRELMYLGPRRESEKAASSKQSAAELPGLKFDDPDKTEAHRVTRRFLILAARFCEARA